MKTKKILTYVTSVFLFCGLLLSTSCSDDDDNSFNDLTGITSFKFTDDVIKDFPFTVDNVNYTIENKDSLPYQFDASNLTAVFEVIAGTTVTVNGTPQASGSSKNDFSTAVNYLATSQKGTSTKDYTVKVNIAQLNPEGLKWNQATPNAFDDSYDSQKYFSLNGKHYIIAGKTKQSEGKLFSSTDGVSWEEETTSGDFPMGYNHNIVVKDGTVYVVGFLEMIDPYGLGDPQFYQPALSEDVYYTADGVTWAKSVGALAEGEGWGKVYYGRINTPAYELDGNIYAVGGNGSVFSNFQGAKGEDAIFYPAATIPNTTLLSTDGMNYTVSGDYTAEMPRRTHAASYIFDGKMYLAGGLDASGYNLSDVWSSTDGVNWTLVSDGAFLARHKASTVVYDDKIWMIGGLLSDGSCTADILVSEDGGVSWIAVEQDQALPSNFTARCNAQVSVDENGNLWIIGGEETELSTNEDGNTSVTYIPLTDVWTGKLNKL